MEILPTGCNKCSVKKEVETMHVKVIDGCISCGLCVNSCPEVFRFNDEGVAEAYEQPAGNEAEVKQAADNCPVSVIETEV